jgi:DNA-binding response OmpR family regulator
MSSSVLVIEPHGDLRTEIVATLQKQRYRCDAVASIQDALLKIRGTDYGCILLDVDSLLVEQDVEKLVADAHTRDSLVLITDAAPDEQLPLIAGVARPMLRKPFDRLELLARIRA